jgi:hypothetical protein
MLDESDHRLGPGERVLDSQIVAVYIQELHHRHKGGAFVALLEGMGLRETGQQPDGERDDILLAVAKALRGRAKALSSKP